MLLVFSCHSSIAMFFPIIMRLLGELDNVGLEIGKDAMRFNLPKTGDGFEIYINISEESRTNKEMDNISIAIQRLLNNLFELAPEKRFQIISEGKNWVTLC